jgi:two-component system chemotaxis sensor kinase CheA
MTENLACLEDDELIQEFAVEANEHLADIESQLLSIEAAGANIDSHLVNQVFRAIHSIKGAASFLGLATINKLAHAMENVLNHIRTRELIPTSTRVNVLLKSADMLQSLIHRIAESNEQDVSEFLIVLDQINDEASGSASDEATISDAMTVTATSPVTTASPDSTAFSETAAVEPVAQVSAPPLLAPTKPAASTNSNSSAPADANIRVAVSVVEQLMNLAGELVLSRNQLLQAVSRGDRQALNNAAGGLDQVTSELQEAIMRTRMQPVRTVFGRFPRVVRDLSASLGKHVELIVVGDDVEVDKTIIEAIGDPLTHLIRNSIDHGIETPTVREAADKSRSGKVRLHAYHQAGKVRIDVEDDGAGINPDKLRQKAVSMGLMSTERAQQLSDRDAIRLIFHPGLSTAAAVTDVSGRGVGMDVVKTNIEKLGGTVDVESVLGRGTSIRITLPLTLAIIPSLIVHSRNQRFAIPQLNIVELVRVRPGEASRRIVQIHQSQVLRLRNTLLPLIRLDNALGCSPTTDPLKNDAGINIIVVESGTMRYGLIVDSVHDSEEIVVKPLGRHVKECSCLAGATILGDGCVALILDIDDIIRGVDLRGDLEKDLGAKDESASTAPKQERINVLLFTNDPAEMFAVPMTLICRIERIQADQIDSLGGQEILQYCGGTLPLLTLESTLKARPRPKTDNLYVVVFNTGAGEAGLITPHLEDIQEVPVAFDTVTLREPGVTGSFVLAKKTVRLLDLFELAQAAYPERYKRSMASAGGTNHIETPGQRPVRATVLLAEDSAFFQRQVAAFLESEGFQVKAFNDGQQAWDYLQEDEHGINLVVTDIEMPFMTGLQLCSKIKSHPQLKCLPVLAMSTLAGDDDIRRGYDAGVDDYQVKMDREQLLSSVRRLLETISPAHSTNSRPSEKHREVLS